MTGIVATKKKTVEIEVEERREFRVVPAQNGGWIIFSGYMMPGDRMEPYASLSSDLDLMVYLNEQLGFPVTIAQ
ncbi:hypothetical protein CYK37_30020 [Mesorhizobium loti]|nr:hypothetical protein [Mesorhizobium loti]PLP55529.1 hypothetical protein CYK37_30020 [Mesorhizobium loti]